MRGRISAIVGLGLALTLLPAPGGAQGWVEPHHVHPDGGVVRVRSAVSVRIVGRVAQVEVEEWFENRGRRPGEGDYLYPLPGDAVFANVSLFQGDRELRGETMDADAARRIYEEIVRRKKDPALIELAGHGLLRARVFPIAPGEERKITLRYSQLLGRAGAALRFRYTAGTAHPGAADRGTARHAVRDASLSFVLRADDGPAFADPFSPTHTLEIRRDDDGRLVVRPSTPLRGDLTLFLPPAGELVGMTLATHRPSAAEDGYFMLTLSPGTVDAAPAPRDITAVVDVSGSMSGEKIRQTRQALRQLLGSLGGDDRFRLVTFNNRIRTFAEGWSGIDDVARARAWVDALDADGGTAIDDALAEAFRVDTPDGRLPIVVFMTDGLPTVGEENPERIAQRAADRAGRARVFAFGVGYDVNTYLLDRLGEAGRGATEYVEPHESVEAALGRIATRIRHPVLTDLEIAEAPTRLGEIYPERLPDLFAGGELVVFGRYQAGREPAEGELVLQGRRAGRIERFSVHADFPGRESGNPFLPRLWASRKLGVLARAIRLDGPDPERVDALRQTALRYGLLSEYTSYLVREPDMLAGQPRRPLPDRAMQPTTAPAEATGAAAVQAAERQRALREARNTAQAREADADLVARLEAAAPDTRIVGGRTFRRIDGVWTDARDDAELRTITIRPYSDAYFALLRAAPELRPILRELEHVAITGARLRFVLDPSGADTLAPARLDRMIQAFRGVR